MHQQSVWFYSRLQRFGPGGAGGCESGMDNKMHARQGHHEPHPRKPQSIFGLTEFRIDCPFKNRLNA